MNLQYAIGEVLLIFIGITLAIWFDNYNDSLRLHRQEVNTLREIRDGLKNDLTDIRVNIEGHESRIKAYRDLVDIIDQDLPLTDAVSGYILRLIGYTSFITNRAPYETLKARGVDIIRSDTLRRRVLEYYDIKQDWLVLNERDHIDHNQEYIKPMLIKYANMSGEVTFRDFEGFKNDPTTEQTLVYGIITDSFILKLYREIEQDAEGLIALINAEIEN